MQQKTRVVVIAPNLGWLTDVDPRLEVLDGNALAREIDGRVLPRRRELVELFAENLRRYLDGEALRNLVDRSRWY